MNDDPEQVRHRPPTALDRPRELVIVCPPIRSQVNLSKIVRTAGSSGISRIICCGSATIDKKIARDGADTVELEVHRSVEPVVKKLRSEGYRLVGLEQTTTSTSLHDYEFRRKTALIIGNERAGIDADVLRLLDDVVEIPIWGAPFAYNVATATAMALYEYCRQYPRG